MKLALMIALALAACGGKKKVETTEPPPAGSAAEAPPPPPAEGSAGSAASCESEGGKCISQAAAVSCGPKSHDGGCPDRNASYCCIR